MLLARPDLPRSPPWPPAPILLPQHVSVCSCVSAVALLWLCRGFAGKQLSFALWLVGNGSPERRRSHSQWSRCSRSPTRRSRAAAPISVPAGHICGEKCHGDRSRSPVRRLAPSSNPIGACVAQEGGERGTCTWICHTDCGCVNTYLHACMRPRSQSVWTLLVGHSRSRHT